MKIKDVLNIDNGFFAYINYPLDNFTFKELDLLFLSKYGERLISPVVENLLDVNGELSNTNLELLGKIIYNMYSYSWNDQKSVLNVNYDPLENYHETLETVRVSENNNTTNVDNNTYAFNSVDSVDKDNSIQSSEGGLNENVVQTKKGFMNGNYTDIIKQTIDVKSIKLVDLVFNDVKEFISLNLYA